jgi:hypothetical protein
MTAGYSGTPLVRKLGIKPGHRLLLLGAPESFALDLPDGVRVSRRAAGVADVILSFHLRRGELTKRMPALRERMEPAAGLWIAWPKRASKVATDLTEGRRARAGLRQHARRQQGLRDRRDLERAAARDPAEGSLGARVGTSTG